MAGPTPIYTTVDSVKVRLANKVQFQEGATPIDGELPNALLCQLIVDAETLVEQDLRGRYAIPFRSIANGTYGLLPDHSKRVIRMLCDLKAVQLVLTTDFGRGTHIAGEDYTKETKELYEANLKRALGHDLEGESLDTKRFRRTPPLDDLMLAKSNSKADDGFHGMIINTDPRPNSADYAAHQVNDPSRSYIGTLGFGVKRRG